MEVSNNIIAALLVLAIGVTAMNFLAGWPSEQPFGITGMATTGKANVSVQSTASITFVTGYNSTYFGQGTRNIATILNIATDQANTNGFYNGSHCNGTNYGTGTHLVPLCIYNDGNDDSTQVDIKAAQAAGTNPWLDCAGATCDQTPTAQVRGHDNSTSACTSGLQTSWTTLSTSDVTLCTAFGIAEYMEAAIRLGIPSNMEGGVEHYTTLTLTAS